MSWRISQEQLLLTVLYALIVGAAIGAVYDLFRILHRITDGGGWERSDAIKRLFEHFSVDFSKFVLSDPIRCGIIFVEDIIFCLIASCALIVFIFQANNGVIRWFELVGAAVGFAVYYATLGRVIMFICDRILAGIRLVIAAVLTFGLILPLRFIVRSVHRMIVAVICDIRDHKKKRRGETNEK